MRSGVEPQYFVCDGRGAFYAFCGLQPDAIGENRSTGDATDAEAAETVKATSERSNGGTNASMPKTGTAPPSASEKPRPESEDWPRFRGPTGMGTSVSTGLPVAWDPEKNFAWKKALPGPGASSPIVYGNHIYITCYTGYLPDESRGSLNALKCRCL